MVTPALPVDRLLAVLRERGPSRASELSEALRLSQPTISRLVAAADGRVVRAGAARRTRYAALRDVRGQGSAWPLYRIDAQGQPHDAGQLSALYPRGTLLSHASPDWLRDDFVDGLFPGVPWFLDDQRPQGFLGRQFAQRWARAMGLPADVLLWDDDAVLTALLLHGDDAPGHFVLGSFALEQALAAEPAAIPTAERAARYGPLAADALAGGEVGSSAAGEQPKFTATVVDTDGQIRHVIVKFSEPVDESPAARRWADLLIAEHLAGELLTEQGDTSSRSELIWSHGRLCLEVTRFDRIGTYGRRGCVTLAAWSDAHDGVRDDWARTATRMHDTGWIDSAARDTIRQRLWFGRMIGNTDMHFGNLSFFLDDTLPLRVTPGYDMLPMLYRPTGSGAVVAREFTPAAPLPADLAYWARAAAWASELWERVAACDQVSATFRAIAGANREAVERSRRRFGASEP